MFPKCPLLCSTHLPLSHSFTLSLSLSLSLTIPLNCALLSLTLPTPFSIPSSVNKHTQEAINFSLSMFLTLLLYPLFLCQLCTHCAPTLNTALGIGSRTTQMTLTGIGSRERRRQSALDQGVTTRGAQAKVRPKSDEIAGVIKNSAHPNMTYRNCTVC